MGIRTSRERLSLEGFHVLPLQVGDSGPALPTLPGIPSLVPDSLVPHSLVPHSLVPHSLVPHSLVPDVPAPVSLLPHLPEDEPDDEPTGVLGTLKEMPISEVVQTLAQGMKDAIIEVKPKGEPVGTIGMLRGRVVFAEVAVASGVTLVGEAAFQRLFCAHRGAFRIRYNRLPEQRNIDKELTWLLLEAARVLDEQRQDQPVFDTPADGTPSLGTPAMLGLDHAFLDVLDAMNEPLALTNVERTLVDPPPTPPPLPARASNASKATPKKREPLPRTITPFSRFFDEAGVTTPPPIPLPVEAQRFQSLQLAEQLDDVDDIDRMDSDRTTPQRRTGPHPITP